MESVKIIKINCGYKDLIKNCEKIGHGASKVTYRSKNGTFVLKVPKVGKYQSLYNILEEPDAIPYDACSLQDVANELDCEDLAPIYGQFYAELFYYNELLRRSVENRYFARLLKMLAKTYCAYLTTDGVLVIKQEITDKSCDSIPYGCWGIKGYYSMRNKIFDKVKNNDERMYFLNLVDRASEVIYQKKWGKEKKEISKFFKVLQSVNDYIRDTDSDLNVWDIDTRNTGYFNGEIKIFDYGIIGCFDINDYDTYRCEEDDDDDCYSW